MKIKLNIKSIIFMTTIAVASLLFINISFAANTGKVLVETAKLREQADTDSKVLELASQGEEVEILNEEDQWYKVKYKQLTGYIRKDLIELNNKEAAKTKEQTKENETKNTTENIVENSTENIQTENNTTVEDKTSDTNKTENEEEIAKNKKYKMIEDVKIKVIPLISSIELDNVKKDEEVEVVEILNDWVKIKTSNEKEGWIRKEKLATIKKETTKIETANTENTADNSSKVETSTNEEQTSTDTNTEKTEQTNTTKTMYVNSQSVNLRQKADKTSQVIKSLTLNTKVTVLSSTNGWAYIDVNGTKGYVAENLLTSTQKATSRSGLTTREQANSDTTKTASNSATKNTNKTVSNVSTTSTTKKKESTASSKSGSSVVSYAKQFLGCKYVYGGTSPSGFDCSGFTQYVYKHFGVNLNRTAAAQYSNGKSVTSLQAGDLVMFGKSGINHVGIYIGGNTFIHAANKKQGVRTDSMSTGYYKANYVGAKRIY